MRSNTVKVSAAFDSFREMRLCRRRYSIPIEGKKEEKRLCTMEKRELRPSSYTTPSNLFGNLQPLFA